MGWIDCGTRIIEVEWNAFDFMGKVGRLIGRLIDGRTVRWEDIILCVDLRCDVISGGSVLILRNIKKNEDQYPSIAIFEALCDCRLETPKEKLPLRQQIRCCH